MASNADKKNEARAKREAAQRAAEAQAKRNRLLQYLGGAIFLALVAVVLVVVVSGGKDSGGIGKDPDAEIEGVAETKSLLAGVEQNGFTLGDPKAPVTIVEFIDMQCPFCKDHQLDQQPKIIADAVKTGKARLRLEPIALTFMGEDSEAARTVALRMAEKDKAWNFVNLFYWNQGQEQTGYVTEDFLKKITVAAGGTADDITPREPTAEEAAKLKEIDDLQEPLDVTGTPSFAIGKTGADPKTYTPIELSGSGSVAEQIIAKVNELAPTSGT